MMRVRVGRARCEGGCRRVLGEGAGAGLAHLGGWIPQGIAPVALAVAIAIILASAFILAAVSLAHPPFGERKKNDSAACAVRARVGAVRQRSSR